MADTNHIFIIQGALRACTHAEMMLLAGALQDSLAECTADELSEPSTYCETLRFLAEEYEVP